MADAALDCRLVAASNTLRLPPELLSRFAVRRLHSCAPQEFREIVVGVPQRHEEMDRETAGAVAQALYVRPRTREMP